MKKEFCILSLKNTRLNNTERHEIFFGGKNRKKSDMYGLVVYLCYEHHRGTEGCHGRKGSNFQNKLHKVGQHKWMEYYNKTTEEFIKEFGRNYL